MYCHLYHLLYHSLYHLHLYHLPIHLYHLPKGVRAFATARP